MTDVITLISQAYTLDDYGNNVATETRFDVFCEVDSITQSEFYAAANTGLNPEYRFRVFFDDYDGQSVLEFDGKRYGIYRTYRSGDYMELYAERKVGL